MELSATAIYLTMANTILSQENLTLWSWNCRSLKNKHGSLTQYVQAALIPPDVICLQEAGNGSKSITGYRLLTDTADTRVALLVKKDLAVTYDAQYTPEIAAQTLTIWPVKKGRPKVVAKSFNAFLVTKLLRNAMGRACYVAAAAARRRYELAGGIAESFAA